ncbi:sugar transferase [Sinomonas sp. G460-2]|uniref:sugar transferase n=1 Tax=Sinomonas sp. G460-2 TaxID=3393464 RepID=UPI0039F10274
MAIGDKYEAPYALISTLVMIAWWTVLRLSGSSDRRILGYGTEEYKRVITSSLWLFGGIAVFSYVFQLDTPRGYVAIALPLGILSLLIGRWALRARLIAGRQRGLDLERVLVIGSPETVAHLQRQLGSHLEAGYLPVAAYLHGAVATRTTRADTTGLPVVGNGGDLENILTAIEECGATAVAISAGASFDPDTLRQLGWQLAARNTGMIVAPALTDVAGPRIHTQPVAGLPLIHVTTPKLDGVRGAIKRISDILGSALLILLLSPVFIIVALAIKVTDSGPLFYSQERIGKEGQPFQMHKFRSMVVSADAQLSDLLKRQGTLDKPLFKVANDPRLTAVGGFIRRYSLDELPQLWNVLRGSMSLVGPRPQRRAEVELYEDFAHRRLIVKPGLSGLWQVSGRSNLTWDQAIRLDLYYVDNWSLVGDLIILLKTLRAVIQKDGAV